MKQVIIYKNYIFYLIAGLFLLTSCKTISTIDLQKKSAAGFFHEIAKGDSLGFLAKKYNASIEDISEVNNIENTKNLLPGQVIFIPQNNLIGKTIAKKASNYKQSELIKEFPLLLPVNGVIFRKFSSKAKTRFDGISIGAPLNTKVKAAFNGYVLFAGNKKNKYGKIVIIKHKNKLFTVYAHLDSIAVKKGQNIITGQYLGTVGTTGGVSTPQIHFQVREGRLPVDPQLYIAK